MRILQISTSDYGGGAERAARDLHQGLMAAGCDSHLLVGRQRGPLQPEVEPLYRRELLASRVWSRTRQYFETGTGRQASASKAFQRWWGSSTQKWDVVVCHNLHGVYFDLDFLPEMARSQPVVLVLHDLWLLTGHCAYPMECGKFQTGCGGCPDLARIPTVWRDRTRPEWQRKMALIQKAAPALVAVSEWVGKQIARSSLAGLPRSVIPYGIPDVPLTMESRYDIRERLGWPQDKIVYLFVSSGGLQGNGYKDPETLIRAAEELRNTERHRDKLIVTVGGRRDIDASLDAVIRQYDHVAGGLEDFYRAADYFVYPTRVETVGLVLVEAARAGLPAIAVNAGGCPEIVQHGETGWVIPPGDAAALAHTMCEVVHLDGGEFGACARQRYQNLFTRDRMVGDYLTLFAQLRAQAPKQVAATPLQAGTMSASNRARQQAECSW